MVPGAKDFASAFHSPPVLEFQLESLRKLKPYLKETKRSFGLSLEAQRSSKIQIEARGYSQFQRDRNRSESPPSWRCSKRNLTAKGICSEAILPSRMFL